MHTRPHTHHRIAQHVRTRARSRIGIGRRTRYRTAAVWSCPRQVATRDVDSTDIRLGLILSETCSQASAIGAVASTGANRSVVRAASIHAVHVSTGCWFEHDDLPPTTNVRAFDGRRVWSDVWRAASYTKVEATFAFRSRTSSQRRGDERLDISRCALARVFTGLGGAFSTAAECHSFRLRQRLGRRDVGDITELSCRVPHALG